jgi:hypothetical protein
MRVCVRAEDHVEYGYAAGHGSVLDEEVAASGLGHGHGQGHGGQGWQGRGQGRSKGHGLGLGLGLGLGHHSKSKSSSSSSWGMSSAPPRASYSSYCSFPYPVLPVFMSGNVNLTPV